MMADDIRTQPYPPKNSSEHLPSIFTYDNFLVGLAVGISIPPIILAYHMGMERRRALNNPPTHRTNYSVLRPHISTASVRAFSLFFPFFPFFHPSIHPFRKSKRKKKRTPAKIPSKQQSKAGPPGAGPAERAEDSKSEHGYSLWTSRRARSRGEVWTCNQSPLARV